MKYRKKPVIIEATQFYRKDDAWPCCVHYKNSGDEYPVITTLEGDMTIRDGDWIITGIQGEQYPCKPDIFKKTYEKVEE